PSTPSLCSRFVRGRDYTLACPSRGERLKEADDLPALGLGELWLAAVGIDRRPARHRGERDALADPIKELSRRVLRHVHLKVEGTRIEGERRRTVTDAVGPVAHDAVCLVERPAEGDRGRIVRSRVLREARGD